MHGFSTGQEVGNPNIVQGSTLMRVAKMVLTKLNKKDEKNRCLCLYLQKKKLFRVQTLFPENIPIFVYIYSLSSSK